MRMMLSAALFLAAWPVGESGAERKPAITLKSVRGATLELADRRLIVGTRDGAIVGFDSSTGGQLFASGPTGQPVTDIVTLRGRPYWIDDVGTTLRCLVDSKLTVSFPATEIGLREPIRRLGSWQGKIVLHSDSGIRFFDPVTNEGLSCREVLPLAVAKVVEQGPMICSSDGKSGLLVSVRRYGRRNKPEVAGATADIAMLTAYSFASDGTHRLLGSYCASLVAFRDAAGPMVQIQQGKRLIENPYGTADVSHLMVGPEGVVALGKDSALIIPFYKDNWMPNHIRTARAPDYAPAMSYHGSHLWWGDGNRIVESSLEDGSAEVYHPLEERGQVRAIVGDEAGAFVLTDNGVVRVKSGAKVPAPGYVRYDLNDLSSASMSQRRAAEVLRAATSLPAAKRQTLRTVEGLRSFFKAKRLRLRRQALRDQQLGELQVGDLISTRGSSSVYIGEGKTLDFSRAGSAPSPLSLSPETTLVRVLDPLSALDASAFRLGRGHLLAGLFHIGIGSPNPALGHDLFVTWDSESPLDGPVTPRQQRLASMLEGWIGVPYRWGGQTLDGTDCSGLVISLFQQLGIALPRHSQDIGRAAIGEVVYDQLRFGDVLVFPRPKHCAIYVGDGQVIEAISGGVQFSTLRRFDRAIVRRFLAGANDDEYARQRL